MKNLTLTLEKEISLLDRYGITPNELMFIKTLLLLQDEEDEDIFRLYIETLYRCGVKIRNIILSLQDKEIILKRFHCPSEGKTFDPYSIPFNKNFIKNFYRCSFEIGKELFEEYPKFAIIQGNMVSLRGVAKKFDSLEDAYRAYSRKIGNNPEIHNHIIELIKWAKEHNILNCTLATFIVDEKWNDLEAMKNGDNDSLINYDAVKLI